MTLNDLYALFQTPSDAPVSDEKPFAFEPFAMPARATEREVAGQEQALQALREMEAVGTVPEFAEAKPSAAAWGMAW